MIEVQGLGKRFGALEAVRNLGFTVGDGEIFGLLGPNGAGKTTTVRMLAGLVVPSAGAAWINATASASPIARMAQNRRFISRLPPLISATNAGLDGFRAGRVGRSVAARLRSLSRSTFSTLVPAPDT